MAEANAQFTVVTGRRRVGKTSLVWKAYEDEPILYFFVARKAESELCEDYRLEIESKLGIPTMGRVERFAEMFEYVMRLSAERPVTLFIDEFQEFFRVNKSVYSDMQRIWDIYSPKAHLNLVVCGSIYSMMTKIFKDRKEPLYNRQTRFMTVRPFTPVVLKEILAEYNPAHTSEDLLALYSFTGGVAKYVQLLMDADTYPASHSFRRTSFVITHTFFLTVASVNPYMSATSLAVYPFFILTKTFLSSSPNLSSTSSVIVWMASTSSLENTVGLLSAMFTTMRHISSSSNDTMLWQLSTIR